MRLLATYKSEEEAHERYIFLLQKKISCHFEQGNGTFELWIMSEDQYDLAKKYLESFSPEEHTVAIKEEGIHKASFHQPPPVSQFYYRATFTKLFVSLCIVVFIYSLYQYTLIIKRSEEKKVSERILPMLTPIQQRLMYDAPPVIQLMDEFGENYSVRSEDQIKTLPPAGQQLYQQIKTYPVWPGIYSMLIGKKSPPAPLFTDIRRGEVWRIFTPIFLHANLFHILFNMLWLWLLGKMIEHNIGTVRYLSFVLIVAAVTNTLQYLVSGPFFMGFSGVIAAMAGYIWVRKKKAPWEAYAIDFWILKLLGIFIFGFLAVQMVVFILQILHIITFELPFANAAHIGGVVLGMGFGHLKLYHAK